MDDEDNARPAKRQKLEHESAADTVVPPQLTLSSLLLGLPSLLLHPPTHKNYEQSLALSHQALKICAATTSLDRPVECRAATGLAELGLQIGLSSPGIEDEIQRAISKGSLIAQNLPTLQPYRHRLTQLSSQLSLRSGNAKAAQNNLKRALSTIGQHDPPHIVYTLHLALITAISSQNTDEATNTVRSLGAISDLHECALNRADRPVIQLASALRLRALMRAGLWNDVRESLDVAEGILDMGETLKVYAEEKSKAAGKQDPAAVEKARLPSPSSTRSSRSIFEYALIVHTLILGIIFYTYVGNSSFANARLKWLHELLDTYSHRFPKTGIFEIPFTNAPSLYHQLTHPRVLYTLGFLVSSLAKRDLMGRKPKKKVFALEGIIAVDKEIEKELAFPIWASISDVEETDLRLKKIRADMMCELIGASIMRSEFNEAERLLDDTISYTRTQSIFSSYVARLTLHEAQLAHAFNKPTRALQCYQVAAWLSRKRDHPHSTFIRPTTSRHQVSPKKITTQSVGADVISEVAEKEEMIADGEEDLWLNTAARAGELWLRIGLLRQIPSSQGEEEPRREEELNRLRKVGEGVMKDCRGLGGTLEAIAEVLDSCLTKEFIQAKACLRRALNLSTESQDNHLRALVLSLIASHYLHTSHQHAEEMLNTADYLAAVLGATQAKSLMKAQAQSGGGYSGGGGGDTTSQAESVNHSVGNAHLRLWIGERFLELHNRVENKKLAKAQVAKNKGLRDIVRSAEERGRVRG